MSNDRPTNWTNLESIEKFLETVNLPRLTQELKSLNRPIGKPKIELVIKNLPRKKSLDLNAFMGKLFQRLKNQYQSFLSVFRKEETLPMSFYKA